jgi:hypothetical protein
MAEVTYFVALPFVDNDDGVAAGGRPNAVDREPPPGGFSVVGQKSILAVVIKSRNSARSP